MEQIKKLLIEEFKKNNVNYDNDFRYDYVDDSFTDVLKSVIGVVKKLNYMPCCKSDSELLSKRPNTSSSLECFTKSEKQQKGDV